MTVIGPDDLAAFVARVDALGGPGDPRVDAYWRDIIYRPQSAVDTTLDPFGPAYMRAQLALYREMSGRWLDQSTHEHTVFDRARHLAARNPYDHGEPGVLAHQLGQLSRALHLVKPRRGAKLLDMGCGWGLSSELAAYIGLQVQAVDINPDFVELVRQRSNRYRYDIQAARAAFDDFTSTDRFDVILFYECLHHAVEPWTLLARLAAMLVSGGKIVACGEPINNHWWPHWGLRLDPMSVYCIHKHGWFESGWSQSFIVRCLDRALLETRVTVDPDPTVGTFLIGAKEAMLSAAWMDRNCTLVGAALDGDFIVIGEEAQLILNTPLGAGRHELVLRSFRASPVQVRCQIGEAPPIDLALQPGETKLPIATWSARTALSFRSETWIPAQEIGNQDRRRVAFQVSGIQLDRMGAETGP